MNDSVILNETKSVENKTEDVKAIEANINGTVEAPQEPKGEEEKKAELPINPRDDDMGLQFLDKDFVYDCMSVPSCSNYEFRLVTFLMLWARRNNILYEFDDYGNMYLTKGTLEKGEYYPCVTSHLDSVRDEQKSYILAGVPLDLKTERTKDGTHKISVKSITDDTYWNSKVGIGADDKGGVCICLSMFNYVDKLKACFFLEEEIGCKGSQKLNKEWFNDVGYVIGWDSPELYRGAWSCSGTKLFSYDFYEKYMKDVCEEWGYKDCLFSEPYTDVLHIRKLTNIICMNFGNGGYDAHQRTEYSIVEDMDHACGFGLALIEKIGRTRHILEDQSSYVTVHKYKKTASGLYIEDVQVDDTPKLRALGDDKRRGYSYGGSYGASNSGTTGASTHTTIKKEEQLKFEAVKYIVERYDSYIMGLKVDTLKAIKELCAANHVDSAQFEKAIEDNFSTEITF